MNEKIIKPYELNENEKKSLDLLHEGQDAALAGDLKSAQDTLKQSLEIARIDNDPEWIAYIKATLAYLNNNLIGVKSRIPNAGSNAEVLSRLAQGLEQRGSPDYKKDYCKRYQIGFIQELLLYCV